jgi:hypothetical protein
LAWACLVSERPTDTGSLIGLGAAVCKPTAPGPPQRAMQSPAARRCGRCFFFTFTRRHHMGLWDQLGLRRASAVGVDRSTDSGALQPCRMIDGALVPASDRSRRWDIVPFASCYSRRGPGEERADESKEECGAPYTHTDHNPLAHQHRTDNNYHPPTMSNNAHATQGTLRVYHKQHAAQVCTQVLLGACVFVSGTKLQSTDRPIDHFMTTTHMHCIGRRPPRTSV